jgi:von Willebrand factor type A domain
MTNYSGTPLTDPRSLFSSVLFHVGLVLIASLSVLSAALPKTGSVSKAVDVKVDPVDNRAEQFPDRPGQGGGGPGEIGGTSTLPFIPVDNGTSVQNATRDAVAETLLAEILPGSLPLPQEMPQHALPGPQTAGQGIIPGSGSGGGGGAGGGSGGGAGRNVGPGTQFFGARDHAHSFAYVIDCSGSMTTRNSLEVAKRELLASVSQLPPDAQFAVIFYNSQARMLRDSQGHQGLMLATESNRARMQTQLTAIPPDGGTNHMLALRKALGLKPEVIFFLTDAEDMTRADVEEILTEVGPTRIQAVEFGSGAEAGHRSALTGLATKTGGMYRYIDVSQFPRSSTGY